MEMDMFKTDSDLASQELMNMIDSIFTVNAGYDVEYIGDVEKRESDFYNDMKIPANYFRKCQINDTNFWYCGNNFYQYSEFWDWSGESPITLEDVIELKKVLKPEVKLYSYTEVHTVMVNLTKSDFALTEEELYEGVTEAKFLLEEEDSDGFGGFYYLEDILKLQSKDINLLVLFTTLEETSFETCRGGGLSVNLPKTVDVIEKLKNKSCRLANNSKTLVQEEFEISIYSRY